MTTNINDILALSESIKNLQGAGIDTASMVDSLNKMMAAMAEQMKTPERVEPLAEPVENGSAVLVYNNTPKEAAGEIDYYKYFSAGNVDCVTRKENFYDDAMYNVLYRGIKDSVLQNQVKYKLEQKAKEIGGTALVKMFNQTCSAKKKETKKEAKEQEAAAERAEADRRREQAAEEKRQRLAAGKLTEYDNLPEWVTGNKYIGLDWTANNLDGVYKLEESGKSTKILEACGRPVLVNKLLNPIDGGDGVERVEIAYEGEKGWNRRVVERGELLNQNRAVGLADYGVDINSDRARNFTNFMSSMLKESSMRDAIPQIPSSRKLALYKDGNIELPYMSDNFVFEREGDFPNLLFALTPAGDAEKSKNAFKELRKAKTFQGFDFMIAATLSAPIVCMTNSNGFVFNLYGLTGCGKSLVEDIAATIWGAYNMDYGFMRGATNTATLIELVADTLNCLPLMIDDYNELTDEKDKKRFNKTIMQIANGVGKGRATKNLSIRTSSHYKLNCVITAEQSIGEIASRTGGGGGVINRLYEVPAADECPVSKSEIMKIIEPFNQNYGFIGQEYIKCLNELGPDKIKEMLVNNSKKIVEKIEKKGLTKTNKQIDIAAILMTADEIAEKYIFQDGIRISTDDIVKYMTDEENVRQETRLYDAIVDKIYSNPTHFEDLVGDALLSGELWGKYTKIDESVEYTDKNGNKYHPTTISIFGKKLREMAAEENASAKMFISYLRQNGLLYADRNRNDTRERFRRFDRFGDGSGDDGGTRLRVFKFVLPRQDDIPF